MPDRVVTYRYDPETSYPRQYVDHFFRINADRISGRVLDLGAMEDNEQRFRDLSSSISEYISADIIPSSTIDVVADGRRLPFEDDCFDTVILSEVLEHVPVQNLETFLHEIKRVLKSSGTLLASTPFVLPIHGEPNDFYRATHYGLASVFDDVGMSYDITIGGGYSQVLLHHLHRPLFILSEMTGMTFLLYLFALVHYVIVALGIIVGHVVARIFGEEFLSRRYITQFVVASPNEQPK